jgi:tetratricopeptide (TPR) repeat protein
VAQELGESVPVGPPPPDPVEASPSPSPSPRPAAAATGFAREADGEGEARAARAAAAMNIDLSTLMASNAPQERRSNWWMIAVAIVVLVASMFYALSMLRKMAGGARAPAGQAPVATVIDIDPGAVPDAPPPSAGDAGPRPLSAPAAPAGSDAFQARFMEAQALGRSNDWKGLEAMAESWSREAPGRVEPLMFLGTAQAGQYKYESAAQSYEKVLAIDPAHAVKRQLADTWLQANRPDRAAQLYKDVVATTTNDARLWNNYGAALTATGQPTQAAAALETAVRLDPTMKQAWANLGKVYEAMGDQARASAAFANSR